MLEEREANEQTNYIQQYFTGKRVCSVEEPILLMKRANEKFADPTAKIAKEINLPQPGLSPACGGPGLASATQALPFFEVN